MHDRFRADSSTRARPVLDNEWLTEPLRKPLAYQPREEVDVTPGSKADDDPHRPASDRLARLRSATRPAARPRPRPDAEIVFGGEVSSRKPPSLVCLFDHLVGAGE